MIEHSAHPSAFHLRACGESRSTRDFAPGAFIALLMYPDKHDLCPQCRVDLIGMLLRDVNKAYATDPGWDWTLDLSREQNVYLQKTYAVFL